MIKNKDKPKYISMSLLYLTRSRLVYLAVVTLISLQSFPFFWENPWFPFRIYQNALRNEWPDTRSRISRSKNRGGKKGWTYRVSWRWPRQRREQRRTKEQAAEQQEETRCQFIFRILVKEFKFTFIAVPLSSHREESISLDLCAEAHRDNLTTELIHQSASIMATPNGGNIAGCIILRRARQPRNSRWRRGLTWLGFANGYVVVILCAKRSCIVIAR